MRRLTSLLVVGFALASGCAADRPPDEITGDGLVRVPSRSIGGVYRDPQASFTKYRRVMLEPPSISFIKDWREKHPEVETVALARILSDTVALFREEFMREFVEHGPYTISEDLDPDVLRVIPAIEELDIAAPDAGIGASTYTNSPVSMRITGDLRDASTGKLVGRVILFEPPIRTDRLREGNRATNAHEQRLVFAKWTRLVLEALNVAKAERPRSGKPAETESRGAT
jgi:hypothetical protein